MKEEAIRLRKEGLSLNSICQRLSKSKTTVWYWIKDVSQPEKFTTEFKQKVKEERLKSIFEQRILKKKEREKEKEGERLLSGDGRWMIPTPIGYVGKTYIKGLYIYEHRYLMEQKLGRLLSYNEVVHHINGDKLDNCLENLELRTRSSHTSHHSRPKTMVTLICSGCNKSFEREKRNTYTKKKFFCCRRCYTKNVGIGQW